MNFKEKTKSFNKELKGLLEKYNAQLCFEEPNDVFDYCLYVDFKEQNLVESSNIIKINLNYSSDDDVILQPEDIEI